MTEDFSLQELSRLRADFPILGRVGRGGKPIAYLDFSATSQKPVQVIDAISNFYRTSNGAVHRGTHLLGDESTAAFEEGRSILADFIGGRANEIVWTKNATEAINLVALAMRNASQDSAAKPSPVKLSAGDNIVITRAEHHANLVPWQQLCAATGTELRWLDLHEDGRIDCETLGVIDEHTRLVAFTHVSNVTGAVSPVEPIVSRARQCGSLVLLDTCQSSAHMPVNVRELGVDFAVFSSHKMLGPTGIGALWGRSELLSQMPPVLTGGSMIEAVTMESSTFMPAPERFEAGSQPIAQIVGWSAALQYLSGIGMARIAEHERILTSYMLEGISGIDGVRVLGPGADKERIGVVAFAVEGVHPHDVGQVLDSQDIAVRVGHHCAIPLHHFFGVRSSTRASVGPTTTREEIDRFIEALGQVRSYFGGK